MKSNQMDYFEEQRKERLDAAKVDTTRCPKCGIKNRRFRIKTQDSLCISCGTIWK